MIYRGVKKGVKDKKQDRRDILKAGEITVLMVAAMAAMVIRTQQLGIR